MFPQKSAQSRRSYYVRFVLFWVALVQVALASESFPLVALDHPWKYDQSGRDLGTSWRDIGYDDTVWPSGQGVLALEQNTAVTPLIRTILSRTDSNGVEFITHYFRTHFQVDTLRPGYFLTFSNLFDDGAVVYLNGVELFRERMPPGPVTSMTLAQETVGVPNEGVFTITNLGAGLLRTGDNLIAVEVHQPYITSTDVVMGMAVFYAPPSPVTFQRQPADRTVVEGTSLNWQVEVGGELPTLQWFKGGVPIPGAVNASYSIGVVSREHAGQYYVVGSNYVGAVTSRVATLTVVLDQSRPQLVSARYESPGLIRATFSERLEASSAVHLGHYVISNWETGMTLPVMNATYDNIYQVTFNVGSLNPTSNFALVVSGVKDRAGNVVLPGSAVPINRSVVFLDFDDTWRFHDAGVDLGSTWRQLNYDDGLWNAGPALLYNDANPVAAAGTVRRTLVSVTDSNNFPIITHYFRHRFVLPGDPVNARFALQAVIDDGAVIYLNGLEVARYNMPTATTVSADTRASSSATEGAFVPFTFGVTNLLAATNVLAVEVHQFSTASPNTPDITFGLEGSVAVDYFAAQPPQLLRQPRDVVALAGTTARFDAQAVGAQELSWLRDGQLIPNANSDVLILQPVLPNDAGASFQLVAANRFGAATSEVARLTVAADTVAPRVLTADMGTNLARITIAFSEPVDPSSATNVSHYNLRGLAGDDLDILSAEVVQGTNVILQTASRPTGARYLLELSGVRDFPGGNPLPAVRVPVSAQDILVTFPSAWRYNDSGTNVGSLWPRLDYDDSAWATGPGLLAFEDGPLSVPILTVLPPPEIRGPVYYFRTLFQFMGDPATAELDLIHLVDDGAVFFLNGQEVHRFGVPEGQNYQTLATVSVNQATPLGPFRLPLGILRAGINVLAAEVHQLTPFSADVVMGAELRHVLTPVISIPPCLHFGVENGVLKISWEQRGYVLQSAPHLHGPWEPVMAPTLPYATSLQGAQRFFRLQAETDTVN